MLLQIIGGLDPPAPPRFRRACYVKVFSKMDTFVINNMDKF